MKVHIGCGKRSFGDDWYHIDGTSYPHVKSNDIKNIPFKENTVDLIYASHVFEYFDREEASTVLQIWKKCLKPGGIIRLAVPNFEKYVKLYVEEKLCLDDFLGPLYGKWQMNEKTTIYHKTTYDFNSLHKLLDKNGFKNIKLWDWKNTSHSNFDDYSQSYLPHLDKDNGELMSLNVECQK